MINHKKKFHQYVCFNNQSEIMNCFIFAFTLIRSQAIFFLHFLPSIDSLFSHILWTIRIHYCSLFCGDCLSINCFCDCAHRLWKSCRSWSIKIGWRKRWKIGSSSHTTKAFEKIIVKHWTHTTHTAHTSETKTIFLLSSSEKGSKKFLVLMVIKTAWPKEIFKNFICFIKIEVVKVRISHFGAIKAIDIIIFPFFVIRENFIGFGYFPELFLRNLFIFFMFIRMPLNC